MFQDLRYGARMLLQHKMLVLVAALSLGLGIGVTSTIYALWINCCCTMSRRTSRSG